MIYMSRCLSRKLFQKCELFRICCGHFTGLSNRILEKTRFASTSVRFSSTKFRNLYEVPVTYEPLKQYLEYLRVEFDELKKKENKMETTKRIKELEPVICLIEEIGKIQDETKELQSMKEEFHQMNDSSMKLAIVEEYESYMNKLDILKSQVLDLLIPPEYIDQKDIILEISAGVGGQEAMLFTKEMFDMYCHFAHWKGYNYQVLEYAGTDLDGIRKGSISISGNDCGKIFKFEGGVHRVQRVPKTEKYGRIHTSVTTVAILPQPSEVEIKLEPKDLHIETKRASGPGGQHVNKTDSCVRITHLPTGLMVERQTERHQHLNKQNAMKALRAILYQKQIQEIQSRQKSNRKLQIGTGARAEKIRTYNFVQDRITDHRVSESIFDIETFFKGEQKLEDLIKTLLEASRLEQLLEILMKSK